MKIFGERFTWNPWTAERWRREAAEEQRKMYEEDQEDGDDSVAPPSRNRPRARRSPYQYPPPERVVYTRPDYLYQAKYDLAKFIYEGIFSFIIVPAAILLVVLVLGIILYIANGGYV